MSTINQNLPIFKNIENQIISNKSNYYNVKQEKKFNLYKMDIHNSKFCNIILNENIDLYKSSSKKDLSQKRKKLSKQKLKENKNNNIKLNDSKDTNNIKCDDANIMESEKYEKKLNAECQGDREYELCLKKALKEALDENEKVRTF